MTESAFLHFAKFRLQEVALVIMAVVYTARLIWLFRFKPTGDRQARSGRMNTNAAKGAAYSIFNVAMPWAMESTRKNFFFWIQFVVFHIGVTIAIAVSFIIPYLPWLLELPLVVPMFQTIIAGAFLVGCYRILRRIFNPYMRALSSPDDYFSLILLTVWFYFAFFAVPNNITNGEGLMLAYFLTTAFFLIYVPFSKISHYLYYPFMRYWLGRTLGYRGVFPIERVKAEKKAEEQRVGKMISQPSAR
jgi:nitrate reductase gamma subunit